MTPLPPRNGNSGEAIENMLSGTMLHDQESLESNNLDPKVEQVAAHAAEPGEAKHLEESRQTTSNAIPPHIECAVPIAVRAKTDGNGTTGVFLLVDVVEGDLLLNVKEPLLNIIHGSDLKITCDNCLAKLESGPRLTQMTIPNPDLKFKACGGCKTLYYCSKACQKTAWTHHHKFECKVLSELNVSESKYCQKLVSSDNFRCWVRLLVLHKKRRISQEQMDKFLALPAPKTPEMYSDASDKWVQDCVEVIEEFVAPTLSEQDIVRLMRLTHRNYHSVCVPFLMDSTQLYEPFLTSPLAAWGIILDPFIAIINQSCDPNTWLISESNELRVRALRDIPAGTEATFTYMHTCGGGVPDYKSRQDHLFVTRNIKYQCQLCQRGHLGPSGVLLARVNQHEDLKSKRDLIQEAEQTIQSVV